MKTVKKLLCVLLTIAMLVSAVSCAKVEQLPEKQIIDHVYKSEAYSLPEEIAYINRLMPTNDGYILYVQLYENEVYSDRYARFDADFNFIEYFDINVDTEDNTDSWLGDMVVGDDGSIYTCQSTSYYDEATDYYESNYYLLKFDSEYNVVDRINTNELLDVEGYAYIYNMVPLDGGYLAFTSNDTVYVIDGELNIVFQKNIEDLGANYINNLVDTTLGLAITYSNMDYNNEAVILDITAMTLSEPYKMSSAGYGSFYGSNYEKYDLFYTADDGIFGYNFATGEGTEVLNYMNSDMENFYPDELISEPDGSFICTTWNYVSEEDTDRPAVCRLIPVPDNEITPKYIITLGGLYINYNIRNEIFKFNRQNDEFRITLKDYSDDIDYSNNSTYTYEDAIKKINSDIASGNVPDIFVCGSELPLDSYASQGLFEDLYKYIDADETLSRDMFLENVLEAFSTGDKLYSIAPAVGVSGYIGLSSKLDGYAENWNSETFLKLAYSLDDNTRMFQDMTRDAFISTFMSAMFADFVDVNSGKCNFTDGTFADMLTFAKELGESSMWDNFDYSNVDSSFWDEYETQYADGKVLLCEAWISSFDDIMSYMQYNFKSDKITLVGVPDSNGTPVLNSIITPLSISSKSKFKDAAWSFISSMLSPEKQSEFSYGFPVLKDSLNEMLEKQVETAQERKKDYEQNDNDVDVDYGFAVPTTTAGGAIMVDAIEPETVVDAIEPETADTRLFLNYEYANMVLEFLKSADKIVKEDAEVLKIVNEEVARFYSDQCTADEAAAQVQSRVSIYISENS